MKQSISLFILVLLVCVSFSVRAEVINQFPSAEVISKQQVENHSYILPLGRIKKDRNVDRDLPAEYKRVTGEFTSVVWEITDAVVLKEAQQILKAWVKESQFEMLFQCEKRDCGESFAWANSMFNQPLLYGNDRSQSLWVVKNKVARRYQLYYLIERPNRRIYLYRETLHMPEAALDRESITALHASRGSVIVGELPLVDLDQELAALVSKLTALNVVSEPLLLVVHRHGSALEQGADVVSKLKKQLAANGFTKAKVEDVANLSPSPDALSHCWVEWVNPDWVP